MKKHRARRAFAAVLVIGATFGAVTACSWLYPHWGETALPTPTESVKPSESQQPSQSATPSQSASPSKKQVAEVAIDDLQVVTADGVVAVIARASNVFEQGGTCTLTVTVGSSSQSVSAEAEQNVTDTQCGLLEVKFKGLESGKGKAVVTYSSDKFEGSSDPQDVTIP